MTGISKSPPRSVRRKSIHASLSSVVRGASSPTRIQFDGSSRDSTQSISSNLTKELEPHCTRIAKEFQAMISSTHGTDGREEICLDFFRESGEAMYREVQSVCDHVLPKSMGSSTLYMQCFLVGLQMLLVLLMKELRPSETDTHKRLLGMKAVDLFDHARVGAPYRMSEYSVQLAMNAVVDEYFPSLPDNPTQPEPELQRDSGVMEVHGSLVDEEDPASVDSPDLTVDEHIVEDIPSEVDDDSPRAIVKRLREVRLSGIAQDRSDTEQPVVPKPKRVNMKGRWFDATKLQEKLVEFNQKMPKMGTEPGSVDSLIVTVDALTREAEKARAWVKRRDAGEISDSSDD